MSILDHVQLKNVFHYFEEISRIPHGSYHTEAISHYLTNFAKEKGLWYSKDKSGNVIIKKEASAGYEASGPVIIQGHMDMVCEKESGAAIDMEKEGLSLYVEDGFLKAKGTTLGADDGIAIAYVLSVLEDESLKHPKIEAVFTTNEEVGMLGAMAMDFSKLSGRILLNIDSDIEGHFLTSCAGGLTVKTTLPAVYRSMDGVCVSIVLDGLFGGHSGSEIDKEHANAVIELGRILQYIKQRMSFGIAALEGGLKDNAIPRQAKAEIVVSAGEIETLKRYAAEIEQILQNEYKVSEPNLFVALTASKEKTYDILDETSMKNILFYLRNVPNGICHMSMNMKGLVETSLNAGVMKLGKTNFTMTSSVRSSLESRKKELSEKLTALAGFLGGTAEVGGSYPAWEYCADSNLREIVSGTYQKMFGKEPVFEAIHAGLECGIFYENIKDLDAVSFGPDNFDIHTPKERLNIASAERVYQFLVELLAGLK